MSRCDRDLVLRLAELARLRISEGELGTLCEDLSRIIEYLKEVRELVSDSSVEPLYHVWEEGSRTRGGGASTRVDIRELSVEVEDGYVKVPWRGGSWRR